MILYESELEDCVDLFENEDCVLTKFFFKAEYFNIEKIGVGIKNQDGDIENIIIVTERIV